MQQLIESALWDLHLPFRLIMVAFGLNLVVEWPELFYFL